MERRVRQAWWIWVAVIGGTLCLGMSALAGQMRLPRDLIYSNSAGSPGKVVFSHEFHVGVADKMHQLPQHGLSDAAPQPHGHTQRDGCRSLLRYLP